VIERSELVVLFWNVRRKNLASNLLRIANAHGVDLIYVAEAPEYLPLVGADIGHGRLREIETLSDRIRAYAALPQKFIKARHEASHFSIQVINAPPFAEYILGAVHLRSKLHAGADEQKIMARDFIEAVNAFELRRRHERTILFGDFNMAPFESGMVGIDGLNAVASRRIGEAFDRGRTFNGRSYRYFYNPMWSFFGDDTRCAPGSYYRTPSDAQSLHWHIYDQVLVRPAIWNCVPHDGISILDTDGTESLLDSGGRPSAKFSDHLPLIFRLNLERQTDGT
jgi:hypothetical protein